MAKKKREPLEEPDSQSQKSEEEEEFQFVRVANPQVGEYWDVVRRIGNAIIGGDFSGNPRGEQAIDIQIRRPDADHVASGEQAIAFGANNRAAGSSSVTLGSENHADGLDSVAIGYDNAASGATAVAIGENNEASGLRGVAIGLQNRATGSEDAIAIGSANAAEGKQSIAIGNNDEALEEGSIAIGASAQAHGLNSTAVGPATGAFAQGAIAVGFNASADEADAIAIGSGARASAPGEAVIAGQVLKLQTAADPLTQVQVMLQGDAPASHSHASHTGIGADDHHAKVHTHASASEGGNLGTLAADLVLASGKDIRPDAATRGLWSRFINRIASSTDHFRGGSIPAGYAWVAASGIFYGTPAALNYSVAGDYMGVTADGTGKEHFLQKGITNSGAAWQGKGLYGRFGIAGVTTEIGFRVDDGSDLSTGCFAELYMTGVLANAMQRLDFRYQNTVGGGITTVSSALVVPVDALYSIFLYCFYSGGNYYLNGYLITESGNLANITGFTTGIISWLPCAGRAGIFTKQNGNYGLCDWFYNTFG